MAAERDALKAGIEALRRELAQFDPKTTSTSAAASAETAMRNLANGGELPIELQARMEGRKASEIEAPRTVTPEEAARFLKSAEAMLTEAIPARRQYLMLEKETGEWLRQTYPQYLEAKTEEGKLFSAFLAQFPQIKELLVQFYPLPPTHRPPPRRWKSVLATVVRGHMEFEKEHKAREAKKAGKETGAGVGAGGVAAAAGGQPPLAPVPPGRGAAGTGVAAGAGAPRGTKPAKKVALSTWMDAEELARVM